jgi:hypothetical protein
MRRLIMVTQGVTKAQVIQFWYGILDKKLSVGCEMPFCYNLPNPLWLVCFSCQKGLKWTWWRNEWSPLGSTRRTQKNLQHHYANNHKVSPLRLYHLKAKGAKPDSGGGSTSYFAEQGGKDKCWRCGGLHEEKDYPNPP